MNKHSKNPSAPSSAGGAEKSNGNDDEASLKSIGELATEHGMTTRAIRFYESKGMLSPRRIGTARAFDKRDQARLILIRRGRRMGYSLDEIREYLDLYDADPDQTAQYRHLLEKVSASIAELEARRADINATLEDLNRMRAICEQELEKRSR